MDFVNIFLTSEFKSLTNYKTQSSYFKNKILFYKNWPLDFKNSADIVQEMFDLFDLLL